jgi:hypothetical protein
MEEPQRKGSAVGNALCGVPGFGKARLTTLPRNATEGVPYSGLTMANWSSNLEATP